MHADLHKLLPPDVYSALDTSSGMEATARTKLQRTCRDIDRPVGARGTAPASSAPGHSPPPPMQAHTPDAPVAIPRYLGTSANQAAAQPAYGCVARPPPAATAAHTNLRPPPPTPHPPPTLHSPGGGGGSSGGANQPTATFPPRGPD